MNTLAYFEIQANDPQKAHEFYSAIFGWKFTKQEGLPVEKIKKHGGEVALEKFAVVGKCWQGYFIDTQGNTFGIFEVDEKAA